MQAVLAVDLQPGLALFLAKDFVYAGRAVTRFWRTVLRIVHADGNAFILEAQVAPLIFLMVRGREKNR